MRRGGAPRRTGTLAAAVWVVAALAAGTIASRAVGVIDTGAAPGGVLSTAQVTAELAAARAAAPGTAAPVPTSPSPTTTSPPATPTATPSPPVPTAPSRRPWVPTSAPSALGTADVVQTWAVTGGTVAASCRGDVVTLLYATPQDGWTVEVGEAGPDLLDVELHRAEQESSVRATCVAGVPTPQTDHPSTPEGTEDHPG